MKTPNTKITLADVAEARAEMVADPGSAYTTLVEVAAAWMEQQDIPQRHLCERLAGTMLSRYGIDQGWSGIWYHLNGRHRGMDVNLALALLGALETDVLQQAERQKPQQE